MMPPKGNSKRESIDTGRDQRFVRRDDQGQFDEEVDMGRSLAADRRQHRRKLYRRVKEIAAIRSGEITKKDQLVQK